jgi:RimJ/RimL family protein N-acetyltransferase
MDTAGSTQAPAAATPAQAAEQAASVRLATAADRPRLLQALAEAFYADPCMGWVFRDDRRRLAQLERIFGYFGERVWFDNQLTYTTGGIAGASIWVAPERWHVGAFRELLMLPGMISSAGLRDLPRMLRFIAIMESEHPREPHYYLPVIGVSPAWQGKGIGTALLAPMLARCDRERMPAYLEASSPRNRACYERNGFRATGEMRVSDSPPLWPMWREPGGA